MEFIEISIAAGKPIFNIIDTLVLMLIVYSVLSATKLSRIIKLATAVTFGIMLFLFGFSYL